MTGPSPDTIVLSVSTRARREVVDITAAVEAAARTALKAAGGRSSGLCVVFVPHTTAGVTVNENYDPDVKHDVLEKLRRLFPKDEPFFQHAEGNSDSHLMAMLTGTSTTLIIEGGGLKLGQWQGIWFCEYDGPRDRKVWVKVLPG